MRGNEQSPGPEVPPGFLRVLVRSTPTLWRRPLAPFDGTSGRRTALARWLTRTDSPASALLARVMVNRIWKQLFGQGIVPTPDNFGVQGQRPTHPELLEWLSAEFVANGWRIKPLDQAHDDLDGLPAGVAPGRERGPSRRPCPKRSIRATSCSGGCGCAGSRPRSCATRS